jgi:hypothetical protein
MSSYRKDLASFCRNSGWTIEQTRGGHLKLRHPDAAGFVIASNTPRDGVRALRMRADPIGQRLDPRGFRVRKVRCAKYRDEQFDRVSAHGRGIYEMRLLAGVIDEHALAGDVGLPHRRRQATPPLLIDLTVPRISNPVGMPAALLLPQQQRHAWPLQLAMDEWPVR